MHIVVAEDVRVSDVDNLTALAVISDLTLEAINARLTATGLGTASDGYSWIDVEELRARGLESTSDSSWDADFDRMIAYARSKGWCDDAAGAVRAHITPSG